MAEHASRQEAGATGLVTAVEADLLVEGDLDAAELALGGLLEVVAVAVLAEVKVVWVVLYLLIVEEFLVRVVNALYRLLLCEKGSVVSGVVILT